MNLAKTFVGLSALIGGTSIGIVALFALFAPGSIAASVWIVGPLCFMGAAFGFLLSRGERQ